MSEATSSTIPRVTLLPDFPGRELAYHPINSLAGEIRVIVLLHDVEREAPLRCLLETISIRQGKSTEPYNAISYYWGSTENPETIEVYGGTWGYHQSGGCFNIPITSNLALALRQFRAKATAERQRLVIWTDALCIDQTDTEERSAQVGIMRDIYQAAHGVWMWIGGTSLAAETGLHNLYAQAQHSPGLEFFTEVRPNPRLADTHVLQVKTARGNSGAFVALYRRNIATFVSAAYWQRGWIIQEATANNNTYICYGPARYRIRSWALLMQLVRDLSYGRLEQPMSNFISQLHQLWYCQYAWSLFETKISAEGVKQLESRTSECSLMRDWLRTSFLANCWHTSDPRDRVYAIMSAMPSYYVSDFQPNYSKSTEDVFVSASVQILRTARSWSHLQFLAPSGSPYLPSWAIDFTAAIPALPFDPQHSTAISDTYFSMLFRHVMRMFDPGANGGRTRFGAGSRAPFRLQQTTPGVLRTAGIIVDKVASVTSLSTATPGSTDVAKDVLRACYQFLIRNERYTRRNVTLRGRACVWEALCRTLCVGRVCYQKFEAAHASVSEHLWDMVIHDRQRVPESMRNEVQTLYKEMSPSLMAARVIVTQRGRVGVAPREVAVGDSISILASGDVPFVLRSIRADVVSGDAFNLIGGCYIDGKTSWHCSCTSTANRNRNHVRRSRRRGS